MLAEALEVPAGRRSRTSRSPPRGRPRAPAERQQLPDTCFVVRRVRAPSFPRAPKPNTTTSARPSHRATPSRTRAQARSGRRPRPPVPTDTRRIEAGTANPSWETATGSPEHSTGRRRAPQRATELETRDRQPTNRPLPRQQTSTVRVAGSGAWVPVRGTLRGLGRVGPAIPVTRIRCRLGGNLSRLASIAFERSTRNATKGAVVLAA